MFCKTEAPAYLQHYCWKTVIFFFLFHLCIHTNTHRQESIMSDLHFSVFSVLPKDNSVCSQEALEIGLLTLSKRTISAACRASAAPACNTNPDLPTESVMYFSVIKILPVVPTNDSNPHFCDIFSVINPNFSFLNCCNLYFLTPAIPIICGHKR